MNAFGFDASALAKRYSSVPKWMKWSPEYRVARPGENNP
jgi:hypothetical protein